MCNWIINPLWTRHMSHDMFCIKSTVLTFLVPSRHIRASGLLGSGVSGAAAEVGGGVCTSHVQETSSCPTHVHAQSSSFLQVSSTWIWLTGWCHDMDTLHTHYWLMRGESTGYRWICTTKCQSASIFYIRSTVLTFLAPSRQVSSWGYGIGGSGARCGCGRGVGGLHVQ